MFLPRYLKLHPFKKYSFFIYHADIDLYLPHAVAHPVTVPVAAAHVHPQPPPRHKTRRLVGVVQFPGVLVEYGQVWNAWIHVRGLVILNLTFDNQSKGDFEPKKRTKYSFNLRPHCILF